MKRLFYLKLYNPIERFLYRNKKVTLWMENFDMRIWYCDKPMAVKDLIKTNYYKLRG